MPKSVTTADNQIDETGIDETGIDETGKDQLTMPGAEVLLKALEDEGVEVVFGYPGGAVLPIYDALFKNNNIRHILVRHEQAAVHAAEGYARSTGKTGVVLVTSGPGATNAVTGLTDALMDSVPVVCLTGQVPTHLIGNDAFQEADTTGITRACTKHNYLVKDGTRLQHTVIETISESLDCSPAQVLLAWALQRQTSVVVKSTQPQRMRENLAATRITLSAEQHDAISDLNEDRRFNDPGDFCEGAFKRRKTYRN